MSEKTKRRNRQQVRASSAGSDTTANSVAGSSSTPTSLQQTNPISNPSTVQIHPSSFPSLIPAANAATINTPLPTEITQLAQLNSQALNSQQLMNAQMANQVALTVTAAQFRSERDALSQERDKLLNYVNSLHARIAQMKPDTQAITADVIAKTSEQYDELEHRCSEYEETIERLQNENKLLREENELLKQRINLLEGQLKSMQRELDTLKTDFDNHKRDAAAEIEKLKREMEDERVLKVSAETCWLLERTIIDRIFAERSDFARSKILLSMMIESIDDIQPPMNADEDKRWKHEQQEAQRYGGIENIANTIRAFVRDRNVQCHLRGKESLTRFQIVQDMRRCCEAYEDDTPDQRNAWYERCDRVVDYVCYLKGQNPFASSRRRN